MPVVKLEAFRTLEAAIKAEIPELEIVMIQRAQGKKECMPNLVITPVGFRYEPDQEEDVFVPDASHLVLNVGRHEGIVQLRLTAGSVVERAEFEERLLNLFFATEGHPGILLTQVTACPALGRFVAAWELEEEQWDDAKAFDMRFESVLVLNGVIPALVTRAGVYEIKHLQLALTNTLDPEEAPSTLDGAEVVEVLSDGTIVPATP